MNYSLQRKISAAAEREYEDDHLDEAEKMELIEEIREQENIDPEVDSEQIYNDYVINN